MKRMLPHIITNKIRTHKNLLIGSLVWSFLTVFVLGETRRVIAYEGSEWSLFLLQSALLLFVTTVYANFFSTFFKKNPWFSGFSLITAILISGYFPFAGNFQLYIFVGNFLRDFGGINIFSMDYSGWAISTFFIQVPLLYFIIYPVVRWGWIKNKSSLPVTTHSIFVPPKTKLSKEKRRKNKK